MATPLAFDEIHTEPGIAHDFAPAGPALADDSMAHDCGFGVFRQRLVDGLSSKPTVAEDSCLLGVLRRLSSNN